MSFGQSSLVYVLEKLACSLHDASPNFDRVQAQSVSQNLDFLDITEFVHIVENLSRRNGPVLCLASTARP